MRICKERRRAPSMAFPRSRSVRGVTGYKLTILAKCLVISFGSPYGTPRMPYTSLCHDVLTLNDMTNDERGVRYISVLLLL